MARLITLLSIICYIGVVSLTAGKTLPEKDFLPDTSLDDLYYPKHAENDLEEGDATNEMDLDQRETTDEMDMEEGVVPVSRHRRQTDLDVDVTDDNAHISGSHTRDDRHGGRHTVSGTYNGGRGQNRARDYGVRYQYQSPNRRHTFSTNMGRGSRGRSRGFSYRYRSPRDTTRAMDMEPRETTYEMAMDEGVVPMSRHRRQTALDVDVTDHNAYISGSHTRNDRRGGRHTLSGMYNHGLGQNRNREYGVGYRYQSRNGRHSIGGSFSGSRFGGRRGGLSYTYRFRK